MNSAHTLPSLPARRSRQLPRGGLPVAELLWPVIVVGAVLVLLVLSLRLPHPPQGLEVHRPHPAADPIVLLPGEVVAYALPRQDAAARSI